MRSRANLRLGSCVLAGALVGSCALLVGACVGDDPATTAGGTGDASNSSNETSTAARDASDADSALSVDDPMCAAVVGYWPGEGTPLDLTGAATLSWLPNKSVEKYELGKLGSAFSFPLPPAAQGHLEQQMFSGLAASDTFTLALWYKTSELYRTFVSLGSSLSVASNNDRFKLTVGAETVDLGIGQPVASPATFTHLAVVLQRAQTGSTATLFVNGTTLGTTATFATPVSVGVFAANSVLRVGSEGFAGALDEVTLLRTALDAKDVKKLHDTGLPCGGKLVRPDAGPDVLRCPAPSPPALVVCGGNSAMPCPANQVCCNSNTASGCQSLSTCSALSGKVDLACVSRASCSVSQVCCTSSFVTTKPTVATCSSPIATQLTSAQCTPGPTCATGEVQLCATDAECASGTKCTGVTAQKPGPNTPALAYALGACL